MRKTRKQGSATPNILQATYLCPKCNKSDLVVDTGVCSIPKGSHKDTDPLKYQTFCPNCGAVGSLELDSDQLQAIIQHEDSLIEVLLVTGRV